MKTSISRDMHDQLSQLVSDVGEEKTAEQIGVSRLVLARALASLPLSSATYAAIVSALNPPSHCPHCGDAARDLVRDGARWTWNCAKGCNP